MNKIFFISVFLLAISLNLSSQNCYKVIANMNGMDISSFQSQLETAACQVRDTIPAAFQSEFGVFDFGFYQIFRTTTNGFDEAWSKAVLDANGIKRYNVIFGRETTSDGGVDVNFRIKINLPKTGQLSCLTDQAIAGAENEMVMILNQKNKSYHVKEIEAMRVFNALIQRTLDCCTGNRSSSLIDTSLLKIQLCIDNCSNNFSPQNSVAFIFNNKMPDIGFKLYYPQNLVVFCTELFARVTIQYIKNIADKSSTTSIDESLRSRNDVEVFTISNIKLNDFINLNWNNKMQGGRVKLEIRDKPTIDPSSAILKTFDFTIKGQNPKIGEVLQYVNTAYSNVWFMKKLMIHESGTHGNDISRDMEHFNPKDNSHENLHETWAAFSRCPKASSNGDGGFGLMQLTNLNGTPHNVPTSKALWDWKQNIKEGYDELLYKKALVKPKLETELNAVNLWNAQQLNESDKVVKITIEYGGIKWKMGPSSVFGNGSADINNYFNETLGSNERSFLDACLLLAYNGYEGTGNKNFLKLVNPSQGKPYWTTIDNSKIYVKSISEQAVPPPY